MPISLFDTNTFTTRGATLQLLGSHRLVRTLMLLSTLSLLAPGSPARAQSPSGPDFSNVADILQGRRVLFPVDDIVVSFNGGGQPTTTTILPTTGGSIGGETPYTASPSLGAPSLVVAAARMFNLPRAVVVTLFAGSTNLHDQASGLSQSFPNTVAHGLAPTMSAVTDLAGNGYAAIVFIANLPEGGPSPSVPGGAIGTIMAANVNDPTQGFFYGTPMPLPPETLFGFRIGGIAAGDFDGDGANEIAVSYLGPCPPPCFGNPIVVAIFKPSVTTDAQGNVTALTLAPAGSVTIQAGAIDAMTLTAGKYLGSSSSQLALIYSGVVPSTPTTVQPIVVSPTSDPTQVSLTLANKLVIDQHIYSYISAQSGPLDFFENTEQLVVLLQRTNIVEGGTLAVVTFDSQLNASVARSMPVPSPGMLQLGLGLGNFDQPNTDTAPVTLQIAVLVSASCGSGEEIGVQIYNVNPASNFEITVGGIGSAALLGCANNQGLWAGIATGDTQGRSLILGPPSKLIAKHTQPELVLGAPPMHVDYVTPANSTGPVVLNLSAVPQGFSSSYQTTVTDQTQSSRQATTSYANAVQSSISGGYKFGVGALGGVTVKVGASAGFMHRKTIEKRYGQYASTTFDASTSTGFDDQVWFTEQTHYIYIYQVIGQTACPADEPDCTDPAPVLVMFSGPTVTLKEIVGGATLEWYQPVHEIGNVFSYPWSLQQLQAAEGDIDLLTSADPDGFATDDSTQKAQATWAGQQSTTSTSGSTSNINWGASVSVTKTAGVFGGPLGSVDVSYNGSKAISTLNTLTTKVGASTGIGIVKPGTFPNPGLYQYSIFPYIFGDVVVPGTIQDIVLGTEVQTSGILRAAYTADPTRLSAGAWWATAYTQPDVALNHPSRWNLQLITPTSTRLNCIPTTTLPHYQDCATFNPPEADIWTSEFHYMKGLLITPADVNGEGPQMTQAVAGAPLLLRARVYNYSLADMPAGSTVVVQFYGQPWDQTGLVPAGNAFLIDQVELAALPGFNSEASQGTAPNWAIASTAKLDTGAYADQYLVFWVLVYITGPDGGLVAEMPGHGLTGIPPVLPSITAATKYLQSYSNNIGFYRSLFYVAPKPSVASVDVQQAHVSLESVQASAPRVLLGNKLTVSGLVRSDDAVDGLSVVFRDSAAAEAGTLFDVEPIAHVRAGGAHLVKTVHRPTTCGARVLSLAVVGTAATGQATVQVTLDFGREIGDLIALASRLPNGAMFLEPLLAARAAFDAQAPAVAVAALERFKRAVEASLRHVPFSASLVGLIGAKVDRIVTCASADLVQLSQSRVERGQNGPLARRDGR